jgi:hypothetical protein
VRESGRGEVEPEGWRLRGVSPTAYSGVMAKARYIRPRVSLCKGEGCPGRRGCAACRAVAMREYRLRKAAERVAVEPEPATGNCFRCREETGRRRILSPSSRRAWCCDSCGEGEV